MGEQDRELSRRALLRGVAVTGAAAPVLAACGSGSETEGGSGTAGSGAARAELPTSDVPVDGGKILAEEKVVVTQPAEGEFKAFSAVCTHQGCPVESISEGRIHCPCHGSQFSIQDGSVVQGPATKALPAYTAKVDGGTVTVS